MPNSTVAQLIDQSAKQYSQNIALEVKHNFRYYSYSYLQLMERVAQSSNYILTCGLKKGDRLAIWAPNSPEWVFLFLSCLKLGIVIVPIDWRTSISTINNFLVQAKPKVLFTPRYMLGGRKVTSKVIYLEDFASQVDKFSPHLNLKHYPLMADTAEIVFTSGSTGAPKGVVLTHKNLSANLNALLKAFPGNQHYRFLSILPLSHMLEQMVGLLAVLKIGARITYIPKINSVTITQAVQKSKITGMVVVPQLLSIFLQKIYANAKETNNYDNLRHFLEVAKIIPSKSIRRLMFRPIHHSFGGHLDFIACGGAPLNQSVYETWNRMGVTILQGYGSTEASSVITTNTLNSNRQGSVGRPLPGIQLKFDSTNQLLVKSDTIMKEYFENQEATNKVMENGWYKTGDCGYLDKDDFLFLNGRIKFMIVLDDGKKVFPEDIERQLLEHPGVKECIVVGETTKSGETVHAVVVTNPKYNLKRIIQEVNQKLEAHQQILSFSQFSQDSLPKTHTLKVDRNQVLIWLSQKGKQATSNSHKKPKDDLLLKIISTISDISQENIKETNDLTTDLKFTSLKRVELLAHIETEFGVIIDETKLIQAKNIASVRKLITAGKASTSSTPLPKWPLQKPATIIRNIWQNAFLLPLIRLVAQPKISGHSHIPDIKEPLLITFNHQSHLDGPLVLAALPNRIRIKSVIAAAEDYWFTSRIKATLFRLLFNGIPVNRQGSAKKLFEWFGELADNNWSIILSPEGTRSKNLQLQPFQQGTGAAASLLNLKVLPIVIEGAGKILPKGSLFPKPGKTNITFYPPLTFSPEVDLNKATQQIEEIYKVHFKHCHSL